MEILAGPLPVGFTRRNSQASSSSRVWASASVSASTERLPRKVCRKIDLPRRSLFVPQAAPGRNSKFHGRCWRQIVVASSGKNNGSGKGPQTGSTKGRGGKGHPERKDEGKKREKGRNSGITIDKAGGSGPGKKQAKPSVWSAEFSGGKSPELTEKESGDLGFRARGGSGRVDVVEGGRDLRLQSSNVAPSSVPAPERRKNQRQQLDGVGDTEFLRYLSPLLPIEEEKLLQSEESVPNPLFSTFCSNSAGVWRGVGATFSPITGDFEPMYLDDQMQDIYDIRVLSTVENLRTSKDGAVLPPEQQSLHRKVLWSSEVSLEEHEESILALQDGDGDSLSEESDIYEEVDELGYWEDDEDTEDDEENSDWEFVLAEPGEIDDRWEKGEEVEGSIKEIEGTASAREDVADVLDWEWEGGNLPADDSESNLTVEETSVSVEASYDDGFTEDTTPSDVMEEDLVTWEAGLAFFEDGAYSRGPLELVTDSSSSRDYFNAYTFKVEQCLVAGGHKRLRVVHTVSIDEEENLEVLRLAVYEEEWMGPCNMKAISDAGGHRLKLFSERRRHSPEDIVGSWKVFEVEGMAMHPAKTDDKGSFVFFCKETSIKRGFPAMPKLRTQEDKSVDLSDFSMSWLTGNVSTYVSVEDTGALMFGVGWVCDDGTRLVMERAYGEDGKLVRVNSKSEIRISR